MPRVNISALHEAIENGSADEGTLRLLEACVQEQGAEGYYDAKINKYLLKLYTCFPQFLNFDNVVNILVLAMMRLPGKDLLAFQLMIPLSFEINPKVKLVSDIIRTVESGHFVKFWAERRDPAAQGIFIANGFDDALRSFIFGNICDTFRTIKVSVFMGMLNLENTADYESFCHRNRSAILSVSFSVCVMLFCGVSC